MEHSTNFDKVQTYYNNGLWNESRVRLAVGKWITEDEFTEITGSAY